MIFGKAKSTPRILLALTTAMVACLLLAASASAATYTVDTNSDSAALDACTVAADDCSLRGAIAAANNEPTGPRNILFSSGFGIVIDSPLPTFERMITVDAGALSVSVRGSGTYSCVGSDYAFDLTDPAAAGSRILGVAIAEVCSRTIESNVAAPTLRVGPRRADNTVAVNGVFPGGTRVDIFRADSPASGAEASGLLQAVGLAADGSFSYVPPIEPVPGNKFVAAGTSAAGTSRYSNPVDVPSDLASPVLLNAVAISNQSIRIDFSEPIHPSTIPGGAFAVSVGGVGRPIVNTLASGNSVYIDTGAAWGTGEAGVLSITGATRIADNNGNELLGTPQATIFAGPGEVLAPTVRNFRMSPAKLCQKKTRKCKRAHTYAYVTLNKDARVIFKVYRGARRGIEVVTVVRRLKAGRTRVKVASTLSGRKLAATSYTLTAVAQDSARTLSAPADTKFRVVKSKL